MRRYIPKCEPGGSAASAALDARVTRSLGLNSLVLMYEGWVYIVGFYSLITRESARMERFQNLHCLRWTYSCPPEKH